MSELDRSDPVVAAVVSVLTDVAPDAGDALESVDMDADVWAALDLDSMDFIAALEGLSAAIDHDIPERDAPRLMTLRQVIDYTRAALESNG